MPEACAGSMLEGHSPAPPSVRFPSGQSKCRGSQKGLTGAVYHFRFPEGSTFMDSKTSRREFLSAGLMLPVAGASSSLGIVSPPENSVSNPTGSSVKLSYKTLGRTGLKVTTVGFGCMITSDPSVIERAADIGITYFDTARGYQRGNNERMVGAALGAKRKQVVLSTKSGAQDKDRLLSDIDTSLRELHTDYVDIWYLHGKGSPADIRDDMIEAQQMAKKQGKIRFAGVSTHGGQQQLLPWLAQKGVFDVVLTAYNFTMDASMEQAIASAAKAGLGVVGMKVMAGGFRRLSPGDPNYQKLHQDGALLAALKWVINKPSIATTIPSMTDMDQLDENLKAMAHPFSDGEAKLLAAHLEKISPLYCRMCGQCDGACQQGLPVADVLRCLTYADGYGQFALGRERFLELSSKQATVRCGDCIECTVSCPHGVQVSRRVARAQELFA
jgi:predicted aldo/keto reductase-like oxidoreductase